jgi:catechol 2,3-dioxygenase-like lactoylglutathione lyase family enzyme
MNELPRVHVHMAVSDLAKSRDFYTKLFGSPVKEKPGYAKFLPAFGPLNLAISDGRGGVGGHVDHMGIQLGSREDVLRELARVKQAGISVQEEMGVDCCYANQDKFWVKDPDGVEWEFYVLNHDIEGATVESCGCNTVPAPASHALPMTKSTTCCAPA